MTKNTFQYIDRFGFSWIYTTTITKHGWTLTGRLDNDIEMTPKDEDCKGILNFTCK